MNTRERTRGIESREPPRIAAGVATILFPVLLTVGFALHPHLFSPRMTTTAAELVAKFHGQAAFHAGHTIVLAAVPFIIVMFMSVMAVLGGRGKRLGTIGGLIGIVGAVILAADKGALCLVLSAFDSLSGPDFSALSPALQAIIDRRGLLVIFWLLPLLPIGAIIQMVALVREHKVSRALGIVGITGLVLLNNPDLDLISTIGGVLLCAAYIPLGVRFLQRPCRGNCATCSRSGRSCRVKSKSARGERALPGVAAA
jgi:hypothetical protein